MTVYRVAKENQITEFATLESAQAFALSLGLTAADVTTEERQQPGEFILPITARQLRLQIVLNGLNLSDIDAAISQLPDPDKSLAQIEWEYATVYERTHSLVSTIGALLGLNSTQLDQLWINGAQL